jgi:hypothetical protein
MTAVAPLLRWNVALEGTRLVISKQVASKWGGLLLWTCDLSGEGDNGVTAIECFEIVAVRRIGG